MTYQVNILNPKADKLLQDLAALELISIEPTMATGFLNAIDRLRKKGAGNPPSLASITKEVESIRTKRYAKKKA